jgi:putative membrane protein
MKLDRSSMAAGLIALITLSSGTASAGAQLDDATILAIFDQTNSMDVSTGWLGAKRGNSEEVRALGRMVAADHVVVQQMGRDLARRLGIVPTPPDRDTSAADHARTIALLQSRSGAEFDRAYLRHELAFHQSVIDAVKGTLLPAVSDGELRKLVKDVLPGFERHLAETRGVARKLGVE